MSLSEAYKEIFKTNNLTTNLDNLNDVYENNILVKNIVKFINKDKKRPICSPFSK